MARKRVSVTLSLSPGTKEKLDRLAVENGFLWGTEPNPSRLLDAIANEEIRLTKDKPALAATQLRRHLEIALDAARELERNT